MKIATGSPPPDPVAISATSATPLRRGALPCCGDGIGGDVVEHFRVAIKLWLHILSTRNAFVEEPVVSAADRFFVTPQA